MNEKLQVLGLVGAYLGQPHFHWEFQRCGAPIDAKQREEDGLVESERVRSGIYSDTGRPWGGVKGE